MNRNSNNSSKDVLKELSGHRLDIYRFMLTRNKPVGVREVTRALNLRSPSVVSHHLSRLVDMDLVKHESGNFVVNKVVLQSYVKVKRFLFPRTLLYLLFTIIAFLVELVVYPSIFSSYLPILLVIKVLIIAFFAYETVKIWREKTI